MLILMKLIRTPQVGRKYKRNHEMMQFRKIHGEFISLLAEDLVKEANWSDN